MSHQAGVHCVWPFFGRVREVDHDNARPATKLKTRRLWLGPGPRLARQRAAGEVCLGSHQRGDGGQTHPSAGGLSLRRALEGGEAAHELSQARARILGDAAVACLLACCWQPFSLLTNPALLLPAVVAVPLALLVDLCFFSCFLRFPFPSNLPTRTTADRVLRHCIESAPRPRHGMLRL